MKIWNVRNEVMSAVVVTAMAVLMAWAGCRENAAAPPAPLTPWELWQSLALHDYTIDQRRSCFCPNAGEVVRITVRADTIADVRRLSDGSIMTDPFYRTVDSLFGIIRSASGDSLVVRYNDEYGYPEFLDVNPQLHPVDGGYLYETFNLQTP